MSSAEAAANEANRARPLYVSIELVSNLVYLARNCEESPDQQRFYLERAAEVLVELSHHPDLAT